VEPSAACRALTLGEVEVIRIIEYEGNTRAPEVMFAGVDAEAWIRNRSWLSPDYWDTEANLLRTCVQTWALRSAGAVILIDTGVGTGKQRPALPAFHMLDSTYLAQLRDAGIEPGDVDVVVNTHLHADHVGWNTRAAGGEWVPTFPNARYLLPRADYEFWDPSVERARRTGQANLNVFADSIAPILRHEQAELWDERHVIDANLTLRTAPGHTPGSSVLELSSRGEPFVTIPEERAAAVGAELNPYSVPDLYLHILLLDFDLNERFDLRTQDGAIAARIAVENRLEQSRGYARQPNAAWHEQGGVLLRSDKTTSTIRHILSTRGTFEA